MPILRAVALGLMYGAVVMIPGGRLAAQDDVVTAGQVAAVDVRSADTILSRRIAINVSQVSRKRAIDAAAASAKVRIQYQSQVIDAYSDLVSVHLTDVPLRTVLEYVLAGTTLRVVPDGDTQLGVVESRDVRPAVGEGTIEGRVVDSATRRGVAHVTIKVLGPTPKAVATTGDDGRFTIRKLPVGDVTITAQLLGYVLVTRTVRVTDGGTSRVEIIFVATPRILSGVVTTATGVQRRLEVGNAITTINVDSVMRVAPVMSMTDLLETRVPGLTVQRTTGSPGDPARIRIRGVASINTNNDPIIVVDGVRIYSAQSNDRSQNLVPGKATGFIIAGTQTTFGAPSPLDQIDPNSIEKVDVMKGPSAAALYGSDAANGVIVITTKRGRAGPGRWNAALNYGISSMPGDWPVGLYSWGTNLAGGDAVLCPRSSLTCRVDSLVAFQALNESRYTMFGRGSNSGASGAVSGGSDAVQYAFTMSTANMLGVLKVPDAERDRYELTKGIPLPGWMRRPDRYRTNGATGQVTAAASSAASVVVMTSVYKSVQERSALDGAIAGMQSLFIDPSQALTAPLIANYHDRVSASTLTWTGSALLRWLPVAWLPLNATVGVNSVSRKDLNVLLRGQIIGADSTGHYRLGDGTSFNRSARLSTILELGSRLTGAMGVDFSDETTEDIKLSTDDLPMGVNAPSAYVSSLSSVRQASDGQRTIGWFVEPRIEVTPRLFVSPGFRLDNNGGAGAGAKLKGFPKTNVSWIVSEESFFPAKRLFDLLRLRGAYGYAGIQPSPVDRLRLVSNTTKPVGTAATAFYGTNLIGLSSLGNNELRPERSVELETGMDAEVWNGRLRVELTRYRKTREDALINLPLAPSLSINGISAPSVMTNIGRIRNTGTELSVNTQVLNRREVSWNVGASMTKNTNEVLAINPGQNALAIAALTILETGSSTRIVPGYPLFGRWARPVLGYNDANNDHIIQLSEVVLGDSVVYQGAQDPNYELVVNSGVTLFSGRLSVYGTVAYTDGMTQYARASQVATSPFSLAANDPNASLMEQANAIATSTSYGRTQVVNTLRFQSLSINYVISPSVARRFGASAMSVALQGQNLGLKTNYSGKDPNVNAYASGNTTVDNGQLPQPRTWSLRFTLGNR